MWKPFSDSENVYMLRLEETENDYNLSLSDLSYIWESQFSVLNLVNNFKENNPLIDATDEQITSDLLDIIQNLQNINVSVKTTGDSVELVFEKSCVDLNDSIKSPKILYKFSLGKKSQNEFRNKITASAIQTIYFLEKQQKMLLNLVQKKDRELEEFRMEKGDISRGDLKTEKFDASVLNANHKELFLNVFSDDTNKQFWQKFTERNGEIETTNLHVELEPWNARPKKRVVHSGKRIVKKGSGVIFKK